jgi:hypothetical protein
MVMVLGSRVRDQPAPAPAPVVWQSLTDPRRGTARQWLDLLADEVEPQIVDSVYAEMVVWSSLWPDRPDDQIWKAARHAFDGRPGCQTSRGRDDASAHAVRVRGLAMPGRHAGLELLDDSRPCRA